MSIRIPSFTGLTLAFALLVPAAASAQRREPPAPPPEALEACENLSSGAACTVETPHGTLSGTCVAPPGRELACMPAHPPGGRGGPPPEALNACEGLARESACSVVTPHGARPGFCHAPEGMPLACLPESHGMTPAAFEACADIEAGDACAVETPEGVREGQCRPTPEGSVCALPPPPRPSRDA